MNDVILTDKISALQSAGATREASYKTIVAGLTAKKMTVDKFGDEHFEEDTTNQLRSAELISKLNGDLKTDNVVDNRQVSINISGDISGLLAMVEDVRGQLASLRADGRQTGEIIDV